MFSMFLTWKYHTRGQTDHLQHPTWSGVPLDDTAGSEGDGLVLVTPVVGVVGVIGVATSVKWLWLLDKRRSNM